MAAEQPQFEFQSSTPKKGADKSVETKPGVELKPEQTKEKTDSSLEGVGKTVQDEFKTPEQQNIVTSEFANAFEKNLKNFSESFQKNFCDDKGQIDLKKVLSLLGLDKFLGGQIDDQGKVKPAEQAAKPNAAPSGTAGGNFEFGAASAGKLPTRPSNAPTGSQFMDGVNFGNMNDKANQYKMEQAILAEIARGNVPSFCRPENMKTMTMEKNGIKVNYKTTRDYLAIGSDNDYVRVPMTPLLAQTLAAKYGWGLPTADITENTYANADIKLSGIGYITAPEGTPENREQQLKMQGNEYILRHNADIEKQLGPEGARRLRSGEAVVGGEKKDVIISQYAIDHPGKLDFRGLYINGKPVQHNPAHEDTYRDYSHGFRPVDGNVVVAYPDGSTVTMKYYDALKDPKIAAVLNGEGGAINAYQAYNKPVQTSEGGNMIA